MRIIHARPEHWAPNNPRIGVGAWTSAFIAVAVIYVAAAAIIGQVINGNGSPFLS